MGSLKTSAGRSFPLGATASDGGINFCVYSRHATRVELLLFDRPDDHQPAHAIVLDPEHNRTYEYWHVLVEGVRAGQLYGYRVDGPHEPAAGMRYDPAKLLVDPYALAVANTERYDRALAARPGDNLASALKSVVVDPHDYDWEGDLPLERPFIDSVIYELHVAGFTRNPNSGVAPEKRGTYAGIIEKIPYLVDLGIKTVELMPVQQFDEYAAPNGTNYWGYQPLAWFAPHRQYSSQSSLLAPLHEFRDLVKALHRANIEVLIDVVFNHTAEGDATGPTLSFRGLDNPTYYILDQVDRARYANDTGCGNTINGNDPVVRRTIVNCLRYWVEHMHVDGFRFDLAASLARGEDGRPLANPPILLDIAADPVLAGTKLIAEPWDAAGLYQLANFGGERWAVWNGQFRDHVRRFVKSDPGTVSLVADHIMGSATVFDHVNRLPTRSVNFVTAHDGFTLNDLVSYDDKHNEANGEENRDGANDNYSWNCGAEGPTADTEIETLRRRQIRNFLTILLMSQGRPMFLMGDEVRRSQQGNNNAYSLNSELAWFDWDRLDACAGIRRFARSLIQLHQESLVFRDHAFWGEPDATRIIWHGVQLGEPDWGYNSHSLAYELVHDSGEHLHVMLNAYWESLEFQLPPATAGRRWHRLVDTSLEAPLDFSDPPMPLDPAGRIYTCQARSSVVLVCRPI